MITRTHTLTDETRAAVFDDSEIYRYSLRVQWDDGPIVQFIGLNPSTATELADDPTLRRCKAFARRDGFGGMVMTNCFAFRATEPKVMKMVLDPVGPQNDETLLDTSDLASRIVACWGKDGRHQGRANQVNRLFFGNTKFGCLGFNKDLTPKHPLYLAGNTPFIPYP